MYLGPYLAYENHFPLFWCYFEISESGFKYYTTDYPYQKKCSVNWVSKELIENLYVRSPDLSIANPRCYFAKEGALHEVCLRVLNQEHLVNAVHKLKINNDHDLIKELAPMRAQDQGIKAEHYYLDALPEELILPPLPNFIQEEKQAPSNPVTSTISIHHAAQHVQTSLSSRQQGIIRSTLATDWPFNQEFSDDEQQLICQSVLTGVAISTTNEAHIRLADASNQIRSYLFPEQINALWNQGIELMDNNQKPSIGAVHDYIYALVEQTLIQLGGSLKAKRYSLPDSIAHTQCGELPQTSNSLQLLYNGLLEHQSHLFNLIIQYASFGGEDLTLAELTNLHHSIEGILQPSYHPDYQEVANDLLAAFTVNYTPQEYALVVLQQACLEIQQAIQQHVFKRLIKQTPEERNAYTKEQVDQWAYLLRFIQENKKVVDSAITITAHTQHANVDAFIDIFNIYARAHLPVPIRHYTTILEHKDPGSLANAFKKLAQAKIGFTSENCNILITHDDPLTLANVFETLLNARLLTQDNFNTLIAYQDLYEFAYDAVKPLHNAELFIACQNLNGLAHAFELLHDTELLIQNNFNMLITHQYPRSLAYVFNTLYNTELLTQNYFNTLIAHQNPHSLACVFEILHDAELLLTQDNFNTFIAHRNPKDLADAFNTLHNAKLLTQGNFNTFITHQNPRDLIDAFKTLHNAELLTQGNFNTLTAHQNPRDLADAFKALHDAELLTSENRSTLVAHQNPRDLADAFKTLHDAKLLTLENRSTLVVHQNPRDLVDAFKTLHDAKLLTLENRNILVAHQYLSNLTNAFNTLHHNKLLIQANFNALITHQDLSTITLALSMLSNANLLTQTNFNALITCQNLGGIITALNMLNRACLLTPVNGKKLLNYLNPHYTADILQKFHKENLLTQNNCTKLWKHEHHSILADLVELLDLTGLLTQDYCTIVLKHQNPIALLHAFKVLFIELKLWIPEYYSILLKCPNPVDLAYAFKTLAKIKLLTAENRDTLIAHQDPSALAQAIQALAEAELLTPENYKALLFSKTFALTKVFKLLTKEQRIVQQIKQALETLVLPCKNTAFEFLRIALITYSDSFLNERPPNKQHKDTYKQCCQEALKSYPQEMFDKQKRLKSLWQYINDAVTTMFKVLDNFLVPLPNNSQETPQMKIQFNNACFFYPNKLAPAIKKFEETLHALDQDKPSSKRQRLV